MDLVELEALLADAESDRAERTISDRLEIQNPGGLYGELTPERFPHGTPWRT